MSPKTYTGASFGLGEGAWARAVWQQQRAQPERAHLRVPKRQPPWLIHLTLILAAQPSSLALPRPPAGPAPRFPQQMDLLKLVRERYLLFAQCVESKPGQEPKHPYLYPQVVPAAAHH